MSGRCEFHRRGTNTAKTWRCTRVATCTIQDVDCLGALLNGFRLCTQHAKIVQNTRAAGELIMALLSSRNEENSQ